MNRMKISWQFLVMMDWHHSRYHYPLLFYDRGSYHVETSPLICRVTQWSRFYMIGTSVMELIRNENRYNDFDKLSSVEFYDGFIQYNNSANNYLFKISKRNRRKIFEICSKLTIKTSEQCHWRRSGVFIVNFEHISHLFLVFLMLTFPKDSYQRSRLAPTRGRQDLNLRILFSFWRVDACSSIMFSVV